MNLGMPCLQVEEYPTCDLKELGDTLPMWPCLLCSPAQPTAQAVISVVREWTLGHLPCAWLHHPHGFVSLKVQAREMFSPSVGRTKFCLPDTNPTAAAPGWRHPWASSGCHLLLLPLCCPIPGQAGRLNPWGFALSVFRCHFSGLFPGRAAGQVAGGLPVRKQALPPSPVFKKPLPSAQSWASPSHSP